jgi:hypothetical protein
MGSLYVAPGFAGSRLGGVWAGSASRAVPDADSDADSDADANADGDANTDGDADANANTYRAHSTFAVPHRDRAGWRRPL